MFHFDYVYDLTVRPSNSLVNHDHNLLTVGLITMRQ
ncbi:hypothetical protein [Vibrio splendidus]